MYENAWVNDPVDEQMNSFYFGKTENQIILFLIFYLEKDTLTKKKKKGICI